MRGNFIDTLTSKELVEYNMQSCDCEAFNTHIHRRYKMNNSNKTSPGVGSSKSGYELRSDLLGMAIGIVDQRVNRMFENEHM